MLGPRYAYALAFAPPMDRAPCASSTRHPSLCYADGHLPANLAPTTAESNPLIQPLAEPGQPRATATNLNHDTREMRPTL